MNNAGFMLVSFFAGAAVGFVVALVLGKLRGSTAREIAGELLRENESRRKDDMETVVEQLKGSFGNLSLEALSKSTDEFLKLATQKLGAEREMSTKELDSKKNLIDQQLSRMTSELEKVHTLVTDLEKDRGQKFGELSKQIEMTGGRLDRLNKITGSLNEALANSKARGQWGERMAEDVLRVAGFVENVNYRKQTAIEGSGNIPDFTFFLPKHLELNMDVKFPFNNYVKYLDADNDPERDSHLKNFIRDVRKRIDEVATRDYIDSTRNTVDYVLLFIPNEQIYGFINEQDGTLMDEGIRKKVILCSPMTLFAVLAVIRQAVDNFSLEQTSNQIQTLLGDFKKQWFMFKDSLNTLGKRIESVQKGFTELSTKRSNQLEKPLNKIAELRQHSSIPASDDFPPELES